MKQILFRGKRIDNGKWVEGYAFDDGMVDSKRMFVGKVVIADYHGPGMEKYDLGIDFREVDPETVGMYSGLDDTDGKKIFEGDIVVNDLSRFHALSNKPHVVRFENGKFPYITDKISSVVGYRPVKVIGNIYDNPEFRKEELK